MPRNHIKMNFHVLNKVMIIATTNPTKLTGVVL